jgi:effector-associated domain 11 (EAD11)-containing protein
MSLVQLKNIRRNLLFLWTGFSVPILFLIFIQTINGKFDGIVGSAWAWVAINLLPILTLLFIGAIQNKHGDKVIQRFIFWIIFGFSFFYLAALLITQFGLSAGTGGKSIYEYFMQSYKWLVPFQVILLLLFSLLFFKKQSIFQPNEKIIKNHFKEKAKTARDKKNTLQQTAFDKLIEGDFEGLFEQLKIQTKEVINDSDKYNETVLLQSQYNEWKKNTEMNLIDTKDAQITLNRISMALVNLIDEL